MTQSNVVNIGSSPNDGTGDPLRIAFANINVQFANLFTNYQLSSALSSNVITLTANNTQFVGSVTAANVVSNAQLIANLANYVLTSSLSSSGYQTVAGLPSNVATLTANNASYLGGTAAASYALSSTLSNYQTTAGLAANVATVTANNTSFVGSVSAANVVSNSQLQANLSNYATTNGATFTGTVTFGSNTVVNTSVVFVGNSSQNAYITSSGLYVNGAAFVSGGGYYKGNQGIVGNPSNANNLFRINANTMSNNITIAPGENALTVGPINIGTGNTLTISTGGRVVII